MDKKTFNKVTKEIFLEYGFIKGKNRYYLVLDDVIIECGFFSLRKIESFSYSFSINALDNLTDPPTNIMTKRYDCLAYEKLKHSPELQGYHDHEILYEEYTEEYYRELLTCLLHKYFDPYKQNAIEYLKTAGRYMALSREAEKYLGISWRPDP